MLHDTMYIIRTLPHVRLTADRYINIKTLNTHVIVRPMANTHNVLVKQFTVHHRPQYTLVHYDFRTTYDYDTVT